MLIFHLKWLLWISRRTLIWKMKTQKFASFSSACSLWISMSHFVSFSSLIFFALINFLFVHRSAFLKSRNQTKTQSNEKLKFGNMQIPYPSSRETFHRDEAKRWISTEKRLFQERRKETKRKKEKRRNDFCNAEEAKWITWEWRNEKKRQKRQIELCQAKHLFSLWTVFSF